MTDAEDFDAKNTADVASKVTVNTTIHRSLFFGLRGTENILVEVLTIFISSGQLWTTNPILVNNLQTCKLSLSPRSPTEIRGPQQITDVSSWIKLQRQTIERSPCFLEFQVPTFTEVVDVIGKGT